MSIKKISPQVNLPKKIQLPGDKSLSHRAVIFSSLAEGDSCISNLSESGDVLSTIEVFRNLGVTITKKDNDYIIKGKKNQLSPPQKFLDCGNAGTLMRLACGVLSAQNFESILVGDESLMKRPMDRVQKPLETLGARIELNSKYAPIKIFPSKLKYQSLALPTPSSQVKSAVLLAGLKNGVEIYNLLPSRDHTENLLSFYGANVEIQKNKIKLFPCEFLESKNWEVPKDPSASAFWCIAALLSQQTLEIKNLNLNPTRLGFLNILKKMGAQIQLQVEVEKPEPMGSLIVYPSHLKGVDLTQEEVSYFIDEVPVLALLASQAKGETLFTNLAELRIKETDRIFAIQSLFDSLGMKYEIKNDDLKIYGNQKIRGGLVNSFKDHRIAMTAAIASFASESDIEITDANSAQISDPYFWEHWE